MDEVQLEVVVVHRSAVRHDDGHHLGWGRRAACLLEATDGGQIRVLESCGVLLVLSQLRGSDRRCEVIVMDRAGREVVSRSSRTVPGEPGFLAKSRMPPMTEDDRHRGRRVPARPTWSCGVTTSHEGARRAQVLAGVRALAPTTMSRRRLRPPSVPASDGSTSGGGATSTGGTSVFSRGIGCLCWGWCKSLCARCNRFYGRGNRFGGAVQPRRNSARAQ